jgi:hypothetical protein
MANTRRDVTASTRGANPLAELLELFPRRLRQVHSNTLTSRADRCQGLERWGRAVPIFWISRINRAANVILALHATTGGSTVSLIEGNLSGQKRYAVSIYPEQTLELPTQPNRTQLINFIIANLEVLRLPGRAVGTWVRKSRRKHILDVVVCPRDCDSAIQLGLRFKQHSIFDLAEARGILVPKCSKIVESRSGKWQEF